MTCPRCQRPVMRGYVFKRNDACTPRNWAMCLRTQENIERQIKRQAVKDSVRGMEGM